MVAAADRLVANTDEEARQLVEPYGADPLCVRPPRLAAFLAIQRPGQERQLVGVERRTGAAA